MPRRTEQECYHCEDGMMVKRDHERWCDTCHAAPSVGAASGEPRDRVADAWAWHFDGNTSDDRYVCVGGYHGAYYGEGSYTLSSLSSDDKFLAER